MYPGGNFGGLITEATVLRPDAPAVLEGDRTLTYAALEKRMRRVASVLAERGVRRGDRVSLLYDNQLEYPEVLFGAMRAGAVPVPLNVRLPDDQLAVMVQHAGSVAVIGGRRLGSRARRLAGAADEARPEGRAAVLLLDDEESSGPETSIQRAMEEADQEFATVPVDPHEVCLQPYTSGSTGPPKGVLLTHGGSAWCTDTLRRVMLLEPDERALVAVPVYHKNAMVAAIKPFLRAGASIVILSGFDAGGLLRAIERHRITFMTGVPAVYRLLLDEAAAGSYDTSSLRWAVVGSAHVPAALVREFQETFEVPLVESYGSTEGGPEVALTPRWGIHKPGWTGLPIPGVEVRVVDPSDPGMELGAGRIGELLVRSPGLMKGYFKAPDLSAERFTEDGFLRTRDLVEKDRSGYLRIVGRVDDRINAAGEHVFPGDVENRLLEHPAVQEACVVRYPHSLKHEVPVAFIVPTGGADITEDELKQWCLDRGPAFAHPRRVFFRPSLPLGGTGKVDRTTLEREAGESSPDDRS